MSGLPRPVKIAIMINTSWNIYNFRMGLVQALIQRGYEVVAIAPADTYSPRLEAAGCRFAALRMEASGLNPLADAALVGRIFSVLRAENPDVLLTFTIKPNLYGSLVGGLLRLPVVCNVSGLGTVFLWRGHIRRLAIGLYRAAFRLNSWVFFQNAADQQDFLEQVGISGDKTSLLPGSGVDLSRFQVAPLTGHQPLVFLMIARLLIDKGVREYAEAIRIFRKKGGKGLFRLVGSLDEGHARGIQPAELDQWVEEGLLDYTPHVEDVRPLIAAADVVVLPSYREGTPRTLLEAGAMGRPAIAADVPGCREVVVAGETGFLCKPKDPRDLSAKMLLMVSLHPDERASMGARARARVESTFDEQLVIDQYLLKIDELLQQKATS